MQEILENKSNETIKIKVKLNRKSWKKKNPEKVRIEKKKIQG